jgi:hypothetical protein
MILPHISYMHKRIMSPLTAALSRAARSRITTLLRQPHALPLEHSEQRLRALENLQVRGFCLLDGLIVIVPRGDLL